MKRFQTIDGPFANEDGIQLQELARGGVVLEIGSWKGKSTVALAETAIKVYACDPHTKIDRHEPGDALVSLDEWKENTEGYNNIVLLLGTSEEMVPSFEDGFFDLIWIDACHDYLAVKRDIELSLSKLKKGGIMVFHDWMWSYDTDGGPTKALEEAFNNGIVFKNRREFPMEFKDGLVWKVI